MINIGVFECLALQNMVDIIGSIANPNIQFNDRYVVLIIFIEKIRKILFSCAC